MSNVFNAYQYMQEHPSTWKDIFLHTSNSEDDALKNKLKKECLANKENLSNYSKKTYSTLKIILKTKDEAELLESWILHHATIVGFENLVILDHSSTSKKVIAIYEKYKDRILVLPVPESSDHDRLHHTRINNYFYDLLKEQCLFFTLIDSDEFLCWNNTETLETKGLVKELKKYSEYESISTTWLHNYFTSETKRDITTITNFDIREHSMVTNVLNGKAIFRSDKKQPGISHNKAAINHRVTTPFVLLHIKHRNIEDRIRTQINYCKSKGLLPQKISHDSMIATLTTLVKKEGKQKHPVHEILEFYSDKNKYIKNLQTFNSNNVLHTNIIEHTLHQKDLNYSFKSEVFTSLDDAIQKTFNTCKLKWRKPGVVFIPRITFCKYIFIKLLK